MLGTRLFTRQQNRNQRLPICRLSELLRRSQPGDMMCPDESPSLTRVSCTQCILLFILLFCRPVFCITALTLGAKIQGNYYTQAQNQTSGWDKGDPSGLTTSRKPWPTLIYIVCHFR